MVPFNERKAKIEEFWKITDCEGDRRKMFRRRPSAAAAVFDSGQAGEEEETSSQEVEKGDLHLMLVFFDCLLVDGVSLVGERYEERRKVLESVVKVIPGFVSLLFLILFFQRQKVLGKN